MAKSKVRRLLIWGLPIIVILVVGALAYKRLLPTLGNYLVVESDLKRADAMVVLSGSFADRILEAVELYKAAYASTIVITKEEEPPGYRELLRRGVRPPEYHELVRAVALQLGVPESALLVLNERSNSTWAEVRNVVRFAEARGLHSLILVTSKYHSARVLKLFNHFNSGKIEVMVKGSRYDPFDPGSWWRDRGSARNLLLEYEKMVFSYLQMLVNAP